MTLIPIEPEDRRRAWLIIGGFWGVLGLLLWLLWRVLVVGGVR